MPGAFIVGSFFSETYTLEAAITPITANTMAKRRSGTRFIGRSLFQSERGTEAAVPRDCEASLR
jgi:hypothetical protein